VHLVKLTVLGAYGPYPAAGGACAGYLLEHEGYSVLIDCGNGVLSRLQQFIEIGELQAIIISHLHSDHFSDLFILRYALQFGREKGEIERPLPVFVPADPVAEYVRLPYKNVYAVEALCEGQDLQLGPFTFTFLKTKHSILCYAVAVYLAGEKIMVYSADTEYFPALSDFARGATLFLCEANFLEEDFSKGASNHLSARQAATLAREAEVEVLLLTHLFPSRNPQLYLQEAARVFKNVEIAREGTVYDLGRPGVTDDPTDDPDRSYSEKWRQLTVKTDSVTASIVAGRLEEEGIPVYLKKDEAAGSIYGLTVGPLANIRVLVPPAKLEQARRLLEEIEGTHQ
jgi:ribonuclease BN (tRNA processing enzyme)